MQIGELFVALGVKGTDKTLNAVSGVRKGLKETSSVSLETKAALVGVMYALERLFAQSGKVGTSLANFNSITGVSAQTLQRYQWAAQKVGVSNEAVEGSFKGLQKAMTDILLNGKAPETMSLFARKLAEAGIAITEADIPKWQQNPEELVNLLAVYNQLEKNAGLRQRVNADFGVSGIEPALTRGAFSAKNLAEAPTYSDREIKALDNARRIWAELGQKIEMAVGHFNAMHGEQIAGEISKIVDSVTKLAEEFMKLDKSVGIFKAIDNIVKGWTAIFAGITDAVKAVNALTNPDDAKAKKGFEATSTGQIFEGLVGKAPINDNYTPQEIEAQQKRAADPMYQLAMKMLQRVFGLAPGSEDFRNAGQTPADQSLGFRGSNQAWLKALTAPPPPVTGAPTATSAGGGVTVNNVLNFQGQVTQPKQVVDAVTQTNRRTLGQINSVTRGP